MTGDHRLPQAGRPQPPQAGRPQPPQAGRPQPPQAGRPQPPQAGGRSWASTLGLTWAAEPPGVVCTFTPEAVHRGPPGMLHGGLAAAVLDETMAALGYVLDGVHTVTATLELRYRAPVPLDGTPLRVEAWRDEGRAGRRVRRVHGRLVLADGTTAVEANGLFARVEP